MKTKPKFKTKSSKKPTGNSATPQRSVKPVQLLRRCDALSNSSDILSEFSKAISKIGLVGESRNAEILFLAIISRLLDRPISVVVKGARSAGKSTLVKSVLRFFPSSAFAELTAISGKAIPYFSSPLKHRMLIIAEAAGLSQEGNYFLRSLLSEGSVNYGVVQGGSTKRKDIDGPTGLIMTTTEIKLYEDDELRLLSIDINESPEHNHKVITSIARSFANPRKQQAKVPDAWPALMEWIACKVPAVRVPFAESITHFWTATQNSRVSRDTKSLLGMVSAHALLHRRRRKINSRGELIATIEDYKAVRRILHEVIAQGIDSSISPSVRQVVKCVERLSKSSTTVSNRQVVDALGLNKAGVSRYVSAAISSGYLRNLEQGSGKSARLVIGDPMPADSNVLPTSLAVTNHHKARIAKLKAKAA